MKYNMALSWKQPLSDQFEALLSPPGEHDESPLEEIERQREMDDVGKVIIHHPGMTMERIESYLSHLDMISRWIEDHDLPDKRISYS